MKSEKRRKLIGSIVLEDIHVVRTLLLPPLPPIISESLPGLLRNYVVPLRKTNETMTVLYQRASLQLLSVGGYD